MHFNCLCIVWMLHLLSLLPQCPHALLSAPLAILNNSRPNASSCQHCLLEPQLLVPLSPLLSNKPPISLHVTKSALTIPRPQSYPTPFINHLFYASNCSRLITLSPRHGQSRVNARSPFVLRSGSPRSCLCLLINKPVCKPRHSSLNYSASSDL